MLINFKNRAPPSNPSNFAHQSSTLSAPASSSVSANHYAYDPHLLNDTSPSNNSNNNSNNDDVILLEEPHEDCVYQVTIKKVYNKHLIDDNNNDINNNDSSKSSSKSATYRPLASSFFSYVSSHDSSTASSSNNSNSSNNITTNDQEHSNINGNNTKDGLVYTRVKIKQLKYATLPKFIEHLTHQETGQLDSHLVQIFLVTYRTFTDTLTAIKLIEKRYEQIVPASLEMTEDVRVEHLKSLRSIIYMWLENYFSEDFYDPPNYTNLNELNRFAQIHFTKNSPELLQLIKSKFEPLPLPLPVLPPVLPPKPPAKPSSHRRSSSNMATASCLDSTGNITYMANSSSNLSKSQLNLAACITNKPPSPIIFNLFKKSTSNANLVSMQSSSKDLMEANFMSIESYYFAEQLTYIDKCLFQKICAHLCLGGVWSTRYQKQNKNSSVDLNNPNTTTTTTNNKTSVLSDRFATIGAFIDQFNIVSFIVQATILENTELKPNERAKIIRKWIEIAQACRNFKNFSSLNAIVQGLNTQCVSRLEKTWNEVSSDYKSQFQELTEMFSEDQNQKIFRRILLKDLKNYAMIFENNNVVSSSNNSNTDLSSQTSPMSLNKNLSGLNLNSHAIYLEGTAKYADINSGINATLGRKYKETVKKQIKKQEPLGTIPFLGTFLKDLEYINAQNPSKMDKGLINVMQKRKEFEIIAQIKLLQQASQLYNITANPDFKIWLHKQTVYSEEQNYKFSNLIEPRTDLSFSNDLVTKYNRINSASRSSSIDSLNSNKTSSTNSHKQNSTHSRNNSNSGIISDSIDRNNNNNNYMNGDNSSTSNVSNSFDHQTLKTTLPLANALTSSNNTSNLVVRVNIQTTNDTTNTVLYKTIFVKDSDRTKDVKRSILEKFLKNPDTCDKYILVQVFTNNNSIDPNQKELTINDNCNVFYAAKSVSNMQFVLRDKNIKTSLNSDSSNIYNNNNKSLSSSSSHVSSPSMTSARANNKFPNNGMRSTSSSNGGNKSTGASIFTDLPPQSPNHQQQSKSNSWNKLYKILK